MDKLAQKQFVLLKKGAEASLHVIKWHEKKAVTKTRVPKRYRPEALDKQIRSYRTVHEPQLMHQAKAAGVPTPLVYMVNVPEATIVMEFIEGVQVKQHLSKATKAERKEICQKIGELVGKLHKEGIIHGDLTTSNMIIGNQGIIHLVDFGLGEKNIELEAKGVDVHLLKRALQSTHFSFWESCFNDVLAGYRAVLGDELTGKIYEKIIEIERRGRYVEERKQ
jgi:TP53 regulating kinase and related kinases